MYCNNCGTQMADGAKFCPKCGMKMDIQNPANQNPVSKHGKSKYGKPEYGKSNSE